MCAEPGISPELFGTLDVVPKQNKILIIQVMGSGAIKQYYRCLVEPLLDSDRANLVSRPLSLGILLAFLLLFMGTVPFPGH